MDSFVETHFEEWIHRQVVLGREERIKEIGLQAMLASVELKRWHRGRNADPAGGDEDEY